MFCHAQLTAPKHHPGYGPETDNFIHWQAVFFPGLEVTGHTKHCHLYHLGLLHLAPGPIPWLRILLLLALQWTFTSWLKMVSSHGSQPNPIQCFWHGNKGLLVSSGQLYFIFLILGEQFSKGNFHFSNIFQNIFFIIFNYVHVYVCEPLSASALGDQRHQITWSYRQLLGTW